MTPTQKLDRILAEGLIPDIGAIIDLSQFKYVYASHLAIRCGKWLIHPAYGELSDGSSVVPDRCPAAWWAHDHLYISPFALYKGVRKELSRRQCDMIYARLGLKYRNPLVFLEGLAMACGASRHAWKQHRDRDPAEDVAMHLVPKPLCWLFVTHDIADAAWIGTGIANGNN